MSRKYSSGLLTYITVNTRMRRGHWNQKGDIAQIVFYIILGLRKSSRNKKHGETHVQMKAIHILLLHILLKLTNHRNNK